MQKESENKHRLHGIDAEISLMRSNQVCAVVMALSEQQLLLMISKTMHVEE
jgi:hypothetical protein